MKVLIWIVNLAESFGEITNAAHFARQLIKRGIEVYFYNSNPFVQNYLYLIDKGFKYLDKEAIKVEKFDIVLFSEYLYLFRSSLAYLKPEREFVEEYFFNKVIIGTIDSYQLANYIEVSADKLIFNLPISQAFENVKFPEKDNFFVVTPCPMGYPAVLDRSSFNNYYWVRPPLISDSELAGKIESIFVTEKESRKVFLPLSKWQHQFWGGKIDSISNFTLRLGEFFTYLLESLELDVPYSFFFGVPSPEFKKYKNKKFEAFFFNPEAASYIPPVYYDQFLAGIDLIFTLHIIQNSFLRAVISGKTGINITHNVNPVNNKPQPGFFLNNIRLDSSGLIGYNKESLESNPFNAVFKSFELLDPGLKQYLRQTILYGKTAEEKNNLKIYYQGLEHCLDAFEIIKIIFSG